MLSRLKSGFKPFVLPILLLLIAVFLCFSDKVSAADLWEAEDKPIVVLSGTELVLMPSTAIEDEETGVASSLSAETSFSLEELAEMPQAQRIFSTLNNASNKKQFLGEGVDLTALLTTLGYDLTANKNSTVSFYSGASYKRTFENFMAAVRYRYPNLAAGSETGAAEVLPLLVLKSAISGDNSDQVPSASALIAEETPPTLSIGQLNAQDINQSAFIKGMDMIVIGAEIDANKVSLLGVEYNRSQLLLMNRVTATYSYITRRGEFTDTVRGVALADLVSGLSDSDTIVISYADGYTPTEISVSDIRNSGNRYMLATEIKTEGGWEAIYNVNDGFGGAYALYYGAAGSVTASGPATMIAAMDVQKPQLSDSPYKHITYQGTAQGGIYAVDAITGATLTVEGPGLKGTTPILVSDLEKTADDNIHRGVYTEQRGGTASSLTYEGVEVLSVVDGLVNSNVAKQNDDIRIVFKNRWRQNVAVISYEELKAAKAPVILAYGTGSSDGSVAAPFVYDDSLGIVAELGNNDGCLKLVYNRSDLPNTALLPDKYSSVAYLYVEPIGGAPGYKHSEASDTAFNAVENTQFLLTLTGSALGREVNYTVEQLEDLVKYNDSGLPEEGGIGHRDDYSLSNTTYWYVNTYEGVRLWDLLTSLGVDGEKYGNDKNTAVWFSSWDNYRINYRFSTYQLAHPELFYYYEKSPADIGTDRPSKEELANTDNQPDNQVGTWIKDSNGYPVKSGYPVMIAYGINGYPYVRSSTMEGFSGGLGNDGGPLRIIYGKADNMNTESPATAEENYAYFFNNGSNQMQRAQEIYVGDDLRFSTHYQNPDSAYTALADAYKLSVEIVQQNGSTETREFSVADLEKLLYTVDKRDKDNDRRQEKAYYYYKDSRVGAIQDLFEGISMEYLLTEVVGMQGSLGTATLYAGNSSISMSLADLLSRGYNSINGTGDLGAAVVFAKNGYPLVAESDSDGYVDTDEVTGFTIKNSGGPIMFVRGQTEAERDAGKIGAADASLEGLTRIVINLEPDKYAHLNDYESYASEIIEFSGAVSSEKVSLTVADIEKLQKYMVTGSYTVEGKSLRFRGIELHRLLADPVIGASALMNEVIVKNAAGKTVAITAEDLVSGVNGKSIILAYGAGNPASGSELSDGKPLVPSTASVGYDSAYGNNNGVLQLIIDGVDFVAGVTSIEVAAASISGWTHSSGFYAEYKDMPILRVTGSGVTEPKTFTVADLEAMINDMVFDSYKMTNQLWFQGVDLWKLIVNSVGLKEGETSPNITAYAADAYATPLKGSDLINGVNGKPVIVAYGQGTSQTFGLPLVDGDDQTNIRPGYDATVGNAFGPVRLVVNDNSGWCVKWLRCIVVGTGAYENPAEFPPEGTTTPNIPAPDINPPPPSANVTYVVEAGDCLYSIATKLLGKGYLWSRIYELNRTIIQNPTIIYPGQELKIP